MSDFRKTILFFSFQNFEQFLALKYHYIPNDSKNYYNIKNNNLNHQNIIIYFL